MARKLERDAAFVLFVAREVGLHREAVLATIFTVLGILVFAFAALVVSTAVFVKLFLSIPRSVTCISYGMFCLCFLVGNQMD